MVLPVSDHGPSFMSCAIKSYAFAQVLSIAVGILRVRRPPAHFRYSAITHRSPSLNFTLFYSPFQLIPHRDPFSSHRDPLRIRCRRRTGSRDPVDRILSGSSPDHAPSCPTLWIDLALLRSFVVIQLASDLSIVDSSIVPVKELQWRTWRFVCWVLSK